MSGRMHAPRVPDLGVPGASRHRTPADVAYRRAWWSLALFPVAFVAAFALGEGLISALAGDAGSAAVWQVLVAAVPALLVFVVPGILAVTLGRRAVRVGRSDGKVPAMVGASIGIGFVGLNVLSYVVGRIAG